MTRKKPQTETTKELKTLLTLTKGQASYINDILKNDITLCSGPAGTGKTAIAVGMACRYLNNTESTIDKIIITRPVVESGRGVGYLPGGVLEKIHPYMVPVLEELREYLGAATLEKYRNGGTIEICPLEFMRGRNFHNTFAILDEAQNCTIEQIKMFITRMGNGSKIVLNGDTDQVDLPHYSKDSFKRCMNIAQGLNNVAVRQLNYTDVVRSPIYKELLQRLNNC